MNIREQIGCAFRPFLFALFPILDAVPGDTPDDVQPFLDLTVSQHRHDGLPMHFVFLSSIQTH
jgi:hypothetical protein